MSRLHRSCTLLLLSLAILLTIRPATAQQSLGSLTGTVTDSTGAMLPGAHVTIKNDATGLEVKATANGSGSYSAFGLPIGTYTVTFNQQGFETRSVSQVAVQANGTTTLDARLRPGTVTTTVQVTATPLLNKVDATNGYTLESQLIESIPLGTGSFTQLAILAPGVNADLLSGSGTNAGLGNQNIFANGQRDTSNSFTFNSVTSNNLFNGLSSSSIGESRFVLNTNEQFLAGGLIQTNTSVFDAIGQGMPAPPQETIDEIHVNTSMYDASQGENSGAHVEVTTKSGTNDFHGEAYEYLQNSALNAAPFFYDAAGTDPVSGKPLLPTPVLRRNTFGGTFGGPIKRDKLFFFGSYQGTRVSDAANGATIVDSVPAGLTDDRSAGALAAVANAYINSNCSNPPCTQVTASEVDPAALAIMGAKNSKGQLLVPSQNLFNSSEISALGGNAIETGPPSTFNADQVNANLDYQFSARDRLAWKYFFQNDPSTSPFAVSQVLGFPQSLKAGSQVYSLDNTTVLRPNLTWEQRAGFMREFANAATGQQLTPSAVGINVLGSPFFPGISISNAGAGNFSGLNIGPANNFANAGVFQNHFEGGSTVNWVAGRNTLDFGVDYDYGQLNVINLENEVATFNFQDFPSFLTGEIGGRNGGRLLDGETNRYYHANEMGAFAQDHFKLRPNLTIDAGVRWDWDGPLIEKYGRLTNFYPQDYSYTLSTDTINSIGLVVAGNNAQFCATKSSFCVNDSTLTGRQWFFQPRVGFAWSPSFAKNLVVRAGFGMYADRGEFFTEFSPSAGLGISGPFGVTTEEPFTVPINASCSGTGCLSGNPFGTAPPAPPPNNFSGIQALVHNQSGLSGCPEPVTPTCSPTGTPQFAFLFGGYDPANTLPYSENWTFDVQWQPYNTLLIDVGYVGNHGVHELLPIPFNQPGIATPAHPINGQMYSYGYQATDADGGFGVLQTEQATTTIGEFTGADGNTALRVPYIGYNPNSDYWQAEGVSNYDALQVSVRKRMSHGLMINGSYTWSHVLDEGSGLSEGLFFNGNDPLVPASAYGSASFDRTHVFTISYLYQIPDLAKSNAVLKQIVNGWGITGITTAESGQPYSVYDFSGTVASQYFGAGDDFITNPLLQVINGTTQSAQLQGTTGVNAGKPVLDGSKFGVLVNAPGTNGVPPCGPTTDEPNNPNAACDFSETGYTAAGRNAFRGPFQTRFDFGVFKTFKLTERLTLRYDAQFFNIFNHPSFDAPSNNISLNPCFGPNAQTSPAGAQFGFACQWFGTIPAVPPSTTAFGNGQAPFGAGFIQNTIGSPRFIQMALHLIF